MVLFILDKGFLALKKHSLVLEEGSFALKKDALVLKKVWLYIKTIPCICLYSSDDDSGRICIEQVMYFPI